MLEKIPEQHNSSHHIHLVSFCSTREPPLFLSLKHAGSFPSSIFPSSQHFSYLPISSKLDSGASSQHGATSPETKKQRHKRREVSGMHTPFGSALDFIPDKMLDNRCQTPDSSQIPDPTTLSQSYHIAKSDFSMPEPFDSVDTAFPYLPRSSLLCLHYRHFHQQLSSHLSRLFRSSFFCLHSPNLHFVSFVPVSLTQETQLSLPSVELTSFQLFRLIRQCLFFVSPNFHFVFTLLFVPPFHTGIRSSDVQSQRNQSPRVLFLEAVICPSCTKDLATGETKAVVKAGLTS